MKIGIRKSTQAARQTSQLFTSDLSDYRLDETLKNLTDGEFMEYVLRNSKKIPVNVAATLIY